MQTTKTFVINGVFMQSYGMETKVYLFSKYYTTLLNI